MAGSILISKDLIVSSGGLVFDYLVERVRRSFKPSDFDCMQEIYKSLDDQGMDFIALVDVDRSCFMTFSSSVDAAIESARLDGSYDKYKGWWDELSLKLRSDSRWGV